MEKNVQHRSTRPSLPLGSPSFEELAAQQGIAPVEDFAVLMGQPAAEDESAEEFSSMLRAWRREGTGAPGPE